MNTYAVIFSDPCDTEWGVYAMVPGSTPEEAVECCMDAVWEDGNLFYGCDFVVWPIPVQGA